MEVRVLSRRHCFFVAFIYRIARLVRGAFRVATTLAPANVQRGAVVARVVTAARGKCGPKSVVTTGAKQGCLAVNFYDEGLRVGNFLPHFRQDSRVKRDRVNVQSCSGVCVVILSRVVFCAFYRTTRRASGRVPTFIFLREVRGLRAIRGLLFYVITGKANVRGCDVHFVRYFTCVMTYRLRGEDGRFAVDGVRLTSMDFGGRFLIFKVDYEFGIYSYYFFRVFSIL